MKSRRGRHGYGLPGILRHAQRNKHKHSSRVWTRGAYLGSCGAREKALALELRHVSVYWQFSFSVRFERSKQAGQKSRAVGRGAAGQWCYSATVIGYQTGKGWLC